MFKYICLALVIFSIQTFNFGSITGAASSATDTITNQLNQLKDGASNIVNSAESTLKTMATTVVDSAQKELNKTKATIMSTVDSAVDKLEKQINSIVDIIKDLSARMCQSQCTSIFNLPCFVLFMCFDKMKYFLWNIVVPIATVAIIICVGCCTGLINLSCLWRSLLVLTGFSCLIWAIQRKCKKVPEQEAKAPEEKDKQKDLPIIYADNLGTEKQMCAYNQFEVNYENNQYER